MKISCILFDLDGTLINTWDLYLEAYRLTVQPYVRKTLTAEDIKNSKPTPELHFIERTIPEKERDNAFRRFITHYGNLYETTAMGMYEGVDQMLEKLRQAGYPLGIFTGKSRMAWEITSRKENFGHFDVIITDNDVENHKPHPEGLRKATSRLNVETSSSLYVGDNLMDFHTASDAGCYHAAALWSKTPEEKDEFRDLAQQEGVRHFLEHPNDLLDLIK
jgi:HAD superfamily hydrolase (TIGR01509 family)